MYKYCGTYKPCGIGKTIEKYEYLNGCRDLNSGIVKLCTDKKCQGIQVIVGCNKDASPKCENPTNCDQDQFTVNRTETNKGTCTPKTNCQAT